MKRSVVSGILALQRVERDKIGAAPYDACLRTIVEGIKPFVFRLGVKILMICFQRDLYGLVVCCVDIIGHVAAGGILYWTIVGLETSLVGYFI